MKRMISVVLCIALSLLSCPVLGAEVNTDPAKRVEVSNFYFHDADGKPADALSDNMTLKAGCSIKRTDVGEGDQGYVFITVVYEGGTMKIADVAKGSVTPGEEEPDVVETTVTLGANAADCRVMSYLWDEGLTTVLASPATFGSSDASVNSITIDGVSIGALENGVFEYSYELPFSDIKVPEHIVVETKDQSANVSVTNMTSFPGSITIAVTSHDGSNTNTYTINGKVQPLQPQPAGHYLISSELEFAQIENTGLDKVYWITEDLDLTNHTPLGTAETPFTGVLLGKKADGSNASINLNGRPLFHYLAGTVGNLTTTGFVTATSKENYFAAFANYGLGPAALTACVNNAKVTSSYGGASGFIAHAYAGGAITLTSCVNNGDITATGDVSGLVNFAWNVTVNNCANTGELITSGKSNAAGIMAIGNRCTINESYNSGNVSAKGNVVAVAGIMGHGMRSITITNCFNSGSLTVPGSQADYGVAGMVGLLGNNSENVTVSNCYNVGAISCGNMDRTSNMIFQIGSTGGVSTAKTYYLDTAAVNETMNETNAPVSKTAEELTDLEGLGFDTELWTVDPAAAYPYPTLIGTPMQME